MDGQTHRGSPSLFLQLPQDWLEGVKHAKSASSLRRPDSEFLLPRPPIARHCLFRLRSLRPLALRMSRAARTELVLHSVRRFNCRLLGRVDGRKGLARRRVNEAKVDKRHRFKCNNAASPIDPVRTLCPWCGRIRHLICRLAGRYPLRWRPL